MLLMLFFCTLVSLIALFCSFWSFENSFSSHMNKIDGQYSNPARIMVFNTAEGWSRDVSQELADEVA